MPPSRPAVTVAWALKFFPFGSLHFQILLAGTPSISIFPWISIPTTLIIKIENRDSAISGSALTGHTEQLESRWQQYWYLASGLVQRHFLIWGQESLCEWCPSEGFGSWLKHDILLPRQKNFNQFIVECSCKKKVYLQHLAVKLGTLYNQHHIKCIWTYYFETVGATSTSKVRFTTLFCYCFSGFSFSHPWSSTTTG